MIDLLVILVILGLVVLFVSAPLRRAAAAMAAPGEASSVGELEAARDAKLRELRDAELDHRTGKLSDEDFQAVDAALRGEAIQILHALDQARGRPEGAAAPATISGQ